MDEQSYQDLSLAEQALAVKGRTLVFVTNGKVFCASTSDPIPALCNDIEYVSDSVIGIQFLGKAASLLCAYGKAHAVFTKQATKTALAVMIRAGIPCQTEKMIPNLSQDSPLFDHYEQQAQSIDDPQEWFQMIKQELSSSSIKN